LSRLDISDWIGVSVRRVLRYSTAVPRRQVYMIVITTAPSARGIQPPSKTLSRLAERKVRSIKRNGTINAAVASTDHFHTFQMTMNAIKVVTTIVPVTAIPSADASALAASTH